LQISRETLFEKTTFFSVDQDSDFKGSNFNQTDFSINFNAFNQYFTLPLIGKHNMENALAAIAATYKVGIAIKTIAQALQSYQGIFRRHQLVGEINGVKIIDDFAHNPVKIEASIKACQHIGSRVIAWFQPHGFAPLKFMKEELMERLQNCMRPQDQFWFSDIYYAGGTVAKTISPDEIVNMLLNKGVTSGFVPNKYDFPLYIKPELKAGDVLLLMGARDPLLEHYASHVFNQLSRQ